MPFCQGCGASYDDTFKFCPHCGRAKPETEGINFNVQVAPDRYEEAVLKIEVVVHTFRQTGPAEANIPIISARKATKAEIKQHEED